MNIKNKKFVFTGALITMSRKQAQALVFSLGGKIQKSISKSTTVLVIEATQKRNEKKHFITIINKKKLMKKSFYH
ncbi:BRCT domain-containing protein [Vagococcus fluvialis]|nr:BRCT domain-containing protein [Vagococcus fluvialis]RCX09955.1 BRCA1 C Terminus (BRCT) protein [Vagococcus fluvialis]WNF90174.1 BRCT domain-containing protein [Vagococcus fluvialis]